MTDDFFDDLLERHGDEAEFLGALRSYAASWHSDVVPKATSVETLSAPEPVYASVRVPGLEGALDTLWIGARLDPAQPQWLRGSWGEAGYVDDASGEDPVHDLRVSGVRLPAASLARIAATWVEQQLQRTLREGELDDDRRLGGRRRAGRPDARIVRRGGFAIARDGAPHE
ncbi:hypothetical protein [Frondihabitans australicus]|uniref:Uncharacterized protein n=1 Tax=Frondihabitans australicus TaxID=386892 RepID=A0A495IHX4_9MICO|nr:hypothetical protein [Frondihabitans australicus]RKR75379.1 hypothetical protein C8E83_2525 [Frondihabitans australicus]